MFGCAVVPARRVQGATLTLRKQRSPGLCRAVPALQLQICRTSWATHELFTDPRQAVRGRGEVLHGSLCAPRGVVYPWGGYR
jgi:hypothetical protein